MSTFKKNLMIALATLIIGLAPQALLAGTVTAVVTNASVSGDGPLDKQVRHQLLMLPYYGVFDNLSYSIDGGKVTLHGQVVRATTRSDAAHAVARIEGVTQVVNRIEVLPLSNFDDSIRMRTYRAIARTAGLQRYFAGSNPSLHIIVDGGQVTLDGVVGNKMDKQLAYMAASGVSGSFSVTNNLQIEGENRAN